MHRESTRVGDRRRGGILILVLALGIVALGATAPAAGATYEYMHGGIQTCDICHRDNHTDAVPTNEKCLTCHGDYNAPRAALTCWTCHTPGQDMSAQRTLAACTTACHLADGTTVTHAAHAGRSATCTTCHPLSASLTEAGGSPHHTFIPTVPSVSGFLPEAGTAGAKVTVTGASFGDVTAVTFNGTPATFKVLSMTGISATVPAGAASGVIAVTSPGGTGSSTAIFAVLPSPPAPTVTTFLPLAGLPGSAVTVTGTGFTGATAVTFGGTAAGFSVVSATSISTTVPAGSGSGPIAVSGPNGTGTSPGSFTVLAIVSSRLTLGVARTTLVLGRSLRASGGLEPVTLAGSTVRLTVQRKKDGAWVPVRTGTAPTTATGAYAWAYTPITRGSYRLRAALAATALHTAAHTAWASFAVR